MLLGELEAKQMLGKAGINVNETKLARTREEAIALAKELGLPAVLKIVSPDIVHKSDSGGVRLHLETPEQVGEAYDGIMASVKQYSTKAIIEGVSVQRMARAGLEVIIGVSQDDQFGPVLMFGLGGTLVEVLKDVTFRVIPLEKQDAAAMIKEIKGYRLLEGYRGQEAVDISTLEELLLKVSQFVMDNPAIEELDLNPVIAYGDGALAVDARIVTAEIKTAAPSKEKPAGSLDFLFHPKSVAVVGASNNPQSRGYDFTAHLINYGFKGQIYPVNPKQPEVLGLKAYPSLDDVPGNVDFVVCAIAIEQIPALLDSSHKKGVKAMHIFSARGSETGRAEGKALDAEILNKARQYNIRLLGPNCMGIYCPEAGFSFGYDFPEASGSVGAMIQSGGSSVDIIKYGTLRGLKFSKVVSYGNALDIDEMDLLNYLADDPATKVIISFVEGLRGDGRDFLELVRRTAKKKPFIICKGGRTQAGARCTMSHTASLAKASPVWEIAIRQAGGIPVRDIDDLVQMAVVFSMIKPIRGHRLGTGGSGGGRNTVSADEWADNGFDLTPLPESIRQDFKERGAQLWDCMENPADRSITIPGDPFTVPALLLEMARHKDFDFICANVAAEDHPFHRETFAGWIARNVEDYIELYRSSPKPFFLIFNDRPLGITEMEHWFWQEVGRMRTRIVEAGVPFFPNVDTAAKAINEQLAYYNR